MLSCEKASMLNSIKYERKLSLQEKTSLKVHSLICKHCRNFDENLSHLHTAMKTFRDKKD